MRFGSVAATARLARRDRRLAGSDARVRGASLPFRTARRRARSAAARNLFGQVAAHSGAGAEKPMEPHGPPNLVDDYAANIGGRLTEARIRRLND